MDRLPKERVQEIREHLLICNECREIIREHITMRTALFRAAVEIIAIVGHI